MQLSGQNLSMLKNSIDFNNGDVKDNDVKKEDKSIFANTNKSRHEVDTSVFVQTKKDNRTSKVPGVKIELGKNLSNLVIIDKSLKDLKTNFETIEKTLNIEADSEVTLVNQRTDVISERVVDIETILQGTEINGTKVFSTNFKLNVRMSADSSEVYKAKVDFMNSVSKFNLDFQDFETNIDKRFNYIRQANKDISAIESLSDEVQTHTKVLKKQMDKFISAGKESTLYHLSSKLDDSNLVNQMKLKSSIFTDVKTLALTQMNTNSLSVLNLLP